MIATTLAKAAEPQALFWKSIMASTKQWLFINEELWFILFGLECALKVEFDASVTESLFQDEKADKNQDKEYLLYSGRSLRVTASVEIYEPGFVTLAVESNKSFEPSLETIIERAGYASVPKAAVANDRRA